MSADPRGAARARPVVAETTIRADREALWRRTQDLADHVRWDARFGSISEETAPAGLAPGTRRFKYGTRLGFGIEVAGWGETVADRGAVGGRAIASALRFGSDHPLSLIREGAGSWVYEPHGDAVRFRTVFDYEVRFGRLGTALDRLAFRPLMTWATRWSFDRLRLWLEHGIAPETARTLWLVRAAALAGAAAALAARVAGGGGPPLEALALLATALALGPVTPSAARARGGRRKP